MQDDKKFLRFYEFEDGQDRDKTIVIVIASILLGLSLYLYRREIGADTTVLIAVIVGLVNAFTLIVNGFFQRERKNGNANGNVDTMALIEMMNEAKKTQTGSENVNAGTEIAGQEKKSHTNNELDIDAELERIKNGR